METAQAFADRIKKNTESLMSEAHMSSELKNGVKDLLDVVQALESEVMKMESNSSPQENLYKAKLKKVQADMRGLEKFKASMIETLSGSIKAISIEVAAIKGRAEAADPNTGSSNKIMEELKNLIAKMST